MAHHKIFGAQKSSLGHWAHEPRFVFKKNSSCTNARPKAQTRTAVWFDLTKKSKDLGPLMKFFETYGMELLRAFDGARLGPCDEPIGRY